MTSLSIPYGRQSVSETDIDAVIEVLRSDYLTQGPVVPRFEQATAAYCGALRGVATSNATSALHLACLALDVGPGDVVWTSPITFVATANCARYCGADVDFVDIDPATLNLSSSCLADKLEEARRTGGKLPKVVIPVHFAGQSCDMAAIARLADEFGFRIIEDAAHAIGGRYRGEPVGACRYSDITVFSFHPVKVITTGEGGMALTNDPSLAERMERLRSHGISRNAAHMTKSSEGAWYYEQLEVGFNYRLTDIQAALGVSQLARLDAFVARRRELAASYDRAFAESDFRPQCVQPGIDSAYHLYVVRVPAGTRRATFDSLRSRGIGVNVHYIPVYLHPDYRRQGFRAGLCPEAEKYYRDAITLPLYPAMSEQVQDYVISAMGEFKAGRAAG